MEGREAEEFARVLAEGATAAAGRPPYDVRLVRLPRAAEWPRKRTSLQGHIEVGAYASVLQENGQRWVYTTTRGKAQQATLQRWTSVPVELITADSYELLLDRLEASLRQAMERPSHDGRSRRATARGFDLDDHPPDDHKHFLNQKPPRRLDIALPLKRCFERELYA